MAQSAKQVQMGFRSKPGFILPSSEEYIEDAINAIKAGKVIAVPTDTLYGFACDAWLAFSQLL
jgi:tRNA A37 threonylcarbamoyladenosine synthetase subunit TsaC/SUA5/YrdC